MKHFGQTLIGTLAVLAAELVAGLAAAGGEMSLEDADRLLETGDRALSDGLLDFARERYTEVAGGTDERHRQTAARLGLARTALAQGDGKAALDALRDTDAAPGAPLSGEILMARAEALSAVGEPQEALDTLEELPLELADETQARAAALRMELLLALGRLDDARAAREKAESLWGPGENAARLGFALADAFAAAGQPAEAAAIWQHLSGGDWPSAARLRARALSLVAAAEAPGQNAASSAASLAALEAFCEADAGEAAPEIRHWTWARLGRLRGVAGDWSSAREAALAAAELAATPAERRSDRLDAARCAAESGDLEMASREMREVAADALAAGLSAEASAIQRELARRLEDAGDSAAAAREWQNWLSAFAADDSGDAETLEALTSLARSLGEAKRFAEAADVWRRVMPRAPREGAENAALWEEMGEGFLPAGDHAAAVEALSVARDLTPAGTAEAFRLEYRLAEAQLAAGDTVAGELQLREIGGNPAAGELAWRASLRLGMLYEERGADESAIAEYTRLLDKGDPPPEAAASALLARGLVRYRLGAFLQALGDFEAVGTAAQKSEAAVQAWFMRGWCQYMLGKDEEALATCRAFLKRHPGSAFAPEVRFWLGEYAYNHGDYAAAEEAFRALAAEGTDAEVAPEAAYWAGRAAVQQGEYLRANECFNTLLVGWPDHPRVESALLAQGDVLAELGQFAEAILAFDEVLAKSPRGPGAPAAWGRKGDCLYTLGAEDPARYDEALLCYRSLHDFSDPDSDFRLQADYKLGRTLEKAGRESEALSPYLEALYAYASLQNPTPEAGVWYTRSGLAAAQLFERSGRRAEASGVYRRMVLTGGPGAQEAAERLKLLEEAAP